MELYPPAPLPHKSVRVPLESRSRLRLSSMPEFVWVKTRAGARTAGFFAFQASGGNLYTSDGTSLEPPPGSVMIAGEELITAISKSAPKGMYVCAWKQTQGEWSQYIHEAGNEHLDAYSAVDGAIAKITDSAGMLTPRNSSKEMIAQKKMGARARKAKVEGDFKDSINNAVQLLDSVTVSAPTPSPRPRHALATPSPRPRHALATPSPRPRPRLTPRPVRSGVRYGNSTARRPLPTR